MLTALRQKFTQTDSSTRLPDATEARYSRFENHIRDCHRSAYNFAYRLTGNPNDAEDLLQEATIRAFRFFDKFDDRYSFQNWLFRILANTHIDIVRRRSRFKTVSIERPEGTPAWDVADLNGDADQELLAGYLEAPLQNALMAINAEFRMAVLLADVEGMAYEEVAEVMQTSVGTVRSRIHRGRKQLRAYLSKHSPELAKRFLHSETDDEL